MMKLKCKLCGEVVMDQEQFRKELKEIPPVIRALYVEPLAAISKDSPLFFATSVTVTHLLFKHPDFLKDLLDKNFEVEKDG